jgi:glutathione synthase/RimK-type ligase-like ATP-grasp enzyme
MILIVTNRQDQTADFLILELKKRKADYIRFNTEDFPQRVGILWEMKELGVDGYFNFPDRRIQFSEITSVWYRRPVSPVPCDSIEGEARNFVIIECLSTLEGIWRTLDCFWVSNPDNLRNAENKLYQLKQAIQVGFQVPQTIITNDPGISMSFYEKNGKDIIYKPIRKGHLDRGENQSVIFTNPINQEAANQLDKVIYAPSLFQKYVHKRIELRVTVIGNKVFAVSLDSQKIPEAIHDWRKAINEGIPHKLFLLPPEICNKCKTFVRNLGLQFGAIDMIITPEEQYVFLEINPNGQWAWIQQICPEIPLRESLADILIYGK